MPAAEPAVVAAGQGGGGDGADAGGSPRAAAGVGAWPSRREARSLRPQPASPRVGYTHPGLGCVAEGHPLQRRGPGREPAAPATAAGVAAAAAAAGAVAAAGTCSSC